MYESIGFIEDEDDDEYPGKARLFWVRHEHFWAKNPVNCEFHKPLIASDMLPVFMGARARFQASDFSLL
jgi:hypothetical protein